MKRLRRHFDPIIIWGTIILFSIINIYFIAFVLPQGIFDQHALGYSWPMIAAQVFVAFLLINIFVSFGYIGGWLFSQIFEVAPKAMLQIQFIRIASTFFFTISQLLKQVQAFIFLIFKPEKQHSDYLLTQVVPLSALPYQLYPQSCILRN